MRMYDLIAKKRDGEALTEEELRTLIKEYTAGTVPDYQMAAFSMAVFFRGMSAEETAVLLVWFSESGDRMNLVRF